MKIRDTGVAVALTLIAAVWGCGDDDEPTGVVDNFGRSHVAIEGTVSTASKDLPVAGARLEFDVHPAASNCGTPSFSELVDFNVIQTDGQGRVSATLEVRFARPQNACVTWVVTPPPMSGLRSEEGSMEGVEFVDENVPPDTLRIDVRLEEEE